mmetsp:Transcript_75986/g.226486  ORF Transcript_75986/g.226486 Transcript_75986/m.226486 type:complete len:274 (+) Transcript_75986:145-966(+)
MSLRRPAGGLLRRLPAVATRLRGPCATASWRPPFRFPGALLGGVGAPLFRAHAELPAGRGHGIPGHPPAHPCGAADERGPRHVAAAGWRSRSPTRWKQREARRGPQDDALLPEHRRRGREPLEVGAVARRRGRLPGRGHLRGRRPRCQSAAGQDPAEVHGGDVREAEGGSPGDAPEEPEAPGQVRPRRGAPSERLRWGSPQFRGGCGRQVGARRAILRRQAPAHRPRDVCRKRGEPRKLPSSAVAPEACMGRVRAQVPGHDARGRRRRFARCL